MRRGSGQGAVAMVGSDTVSRVRSTKARRKQNPPLPIQLTPVRRLNNWRTADAALGVEVHADDLHRGQLELRLNFEWLKRHSSNILVLIGTTWKCVCFNALSFLARHACVFMLFERIALLLCYPGIYTPNICTLKLHRVEEPMLGVFQAGEPESAAGCYLNGDGGRPSLDMIRFDQAGL